MKSKFKVFLAILLSLVLVFSLGACWQPPDDDGLGDIPDEQLEPDGSLSDWVPFTETSQKRTFSSPVTLKIRYFNGGYGNKWLNAMKTKFEAEYPNVNIVLTPSNLEAEFVAQLQATLSQSTTANIDNIYICHNIPWEMLSAQKVGSVELLYNLNTLYDSPVYFKADDEGNADMDETPLRYYDRIAASSTNTVKFNGSYWKVPEVQGAGGIAYNKTLFDQYGWTIPTTYTELMALCQQIAASGAETLAGDPIYPFAWSGTEAYLWDSVVLDWWMQLAGKEEYDRFMTYATNECYNPDVYPYQKDAWSLWYDLVCKNKNFSHPESLGFSNIDLNTAFASGAVAMMPATCWIANEIGDSLLDYFGCDIGLMPTPILDIEDNGSGRALKAKTDEEGNPIRVAYDLAAKDSIVVANRGQGGVNAKNAAVEFLKWMAIEQNANLFPENTNGLLLAVKYDFAALKQNTKANKRTWNNDMFTILENSYRFNIYSTNPKVIGASNPPNMYPNGNYYTEAFEKYGQADAPTPNSIFNAAWSWAQGSNFWS